MAKVVRFTPEMFTPTAYDTAADKAKFANHFVRFVESDFKRTLFLKWFYTRLSMTFGHIAHYDIHGFYATFFTRTADKLDFLVQTRDAGGFGSPAHTYSDVEAALKTWLHESRKVDYYHGKLMTEVELAERAELARLAFKYLNPDGTTKPLGSVEKSR